ncbi:MAG: Hsp70 family protein [Selenomonadaceae bacterium]|nr:Hsp70 family protein [Selenomonadaceae bacterium]
MKYFVGIDLGTTNSSISTFDGENVRVCKNKRDQSDVTPSAIYVDKRGKRFYGKKAYENSFRQPESCAKLFKRFMGTNTKFKLGEDELKAEECSAEILRELFKNLPDEIRENKDEVGTVITVPAAFNQMQNAATLDAAKMAGLGKVALMQEPVAAIMRVMKDNQVDGNFLVFDLGGGTLDVAIAERTSGKINFLANGGLTMCGGRDFDKILFNEFVVTWLKENYSLPEDWLTQKKYQKLQSLATYMAENAKIELSTDERVKIEGETGIEDEDGEEIYIDVEINRADYNTAIAEPVMKAIETARVTIEKSGLSAGDIKKIIFIGGSNNYKPIREKVVAELGISGSMEVNPMTAVSEGAAIFAELVDWNSQEHERKATREQFKSDAELGLSFRYESRTPDKKARIAVVLEKEIIGYTFEITSLDSGWTSGSVDLKNKNLVTVPLHKRGENKFSVEVYDKGGDSVFLENDTITITQTFANVGALLVAHSIGVEVKERLGSNVSRLDYFVREGDTLPAKGTKKFRAGKKVRAGSDDSINFKLWQGEIEDNISDNLFIGALKISGDDFEFGTIIEGAEIICNYTIDDAGSINLEVEIPAVNESFYKNFYSREEGQVNFDKAADKINSDGKNLLEQVRDIGKAIKDDSDYEKLQQAGEIASTAINATQSNSDREELKHIEEDLQAAKKILADIRERNRKNIRRENLDGWRDYFETNLKRFAKPSETTQIENLFDRAEMLIEREDSAFEDTISEIIGVSYGIAIRDNEFVVGTFNSLMKNPDDFDDKATFYRLAAAGKNAIAQRNYVELRKIVSGLYSISRCKGDELLTVNIIKA